MFISEELKSKLIKRYKWILQQGFTRWVDFRNKSVLAEQKNVVNKSWDDQNLSLLANIKQEEAVISDTKHRQQIESAKLLKKQIMDTFRRHLHIKFN